jgi:RNA polymerase sigma-70 factor, ECF subfamily
MSLSDPDADAFLIEGVQQGDEDACEQFDRRFRPRLVSALRRRGVDSRDAEDIAQDTLAAAMGQLRDRRFEGRSPLGAWVWSIFWNRFRDHLRGSIRRERYAVPIDTIGQRGLTALRGRDDQDLRLAVQAAMQALPPRERLVLLLNVQSGRPTREIAQLLKLGVKVTEALLTSAKRRFRANLAAAEETAASKRLKE